MSLTQNAIITSADTRLKSFLSDCTAFNNTLVRSIAGRHYIDSHKDLSLVEDENFHLSCIYRATRDEQIAACTGDAATASKFSVNGELFYCHAFLVVAK